MKKNEGYVPSDQYNDDNIIESESLGDEDEDSVSSDHAYIGHRKDHSGELLRKNCFQFSSSIIPKEREFQPCQQGLITRRMGRELRL